MFMKDEGIMALYGCMNAYISIQYTAIILRVDGSVLKLLSIPSQEVGYGYEMSS